MIVWKQTHRIISAGSRLIRKDSRMKLVRTNTGGIGLRIDEVSQDDRGKLNYKLLQQIHNWLKYIVLEKDMILT